jgi:hypothetical protein
MKDPEFAAGISEMAQNEDFRGLCQLSDDDIKKQQDVEYATRLICHALRDLAGREDLNEFLDRAIMDIMDNVPLGEVRDIFYRTTGFVYSACGEQALIPATARRKVFTLQGLEAILVGVARNIAEISKLADPVDFVREKIGSFWDSEEARVYTSSGMKAYDRISKTVPLGTRWFKP